MQPNLLQKRHQETFGGDGNHYPNYRDGFKELWAHLSKFIYLSKLITSYVSNKHVSLHVIYTKKSVNQLPIQKMG